MKLPENPAEQLEAIVMFLPNDAVLRKAEGYIQRGGTVESLEAATAHIEAEIVAEASRLEGVPIEECERMYRRIFIAMNWRNN